MNQTDRTRIHNILDDINLPRGRYVLAGSGVMVLHGIDRVMRDVDIYVATATWFSMFRDYNSRWQLFCTDPDDPKRRCDPPYLYRTLHGIEVNVFFQWRVRGVGDIDINFWMHNQEIVDNVPCIPLQFLLDWKEAVGRDKDVNDITLIKTYLETVA